MAERIIVRVIIGLALGLVWGFAYLLWTKPLPSFKWFIQWRMSLWGVTATLADEKKYRRMAQTVSILLFLIGLCVVVVSWQCVR